MQVLPLASMIKNYCSRWRRLSLRIPVEYYRAFIGGLTSAPFLEFLQLNPIMTNSNLLQPFHFPGAPRLTHLEVSNTSISRVHVRFDNLTFFKGDLLSSEDIIRLLSSAKSLIRCEFSNVVGDILLAQNEEVLVHQSLKELSIGPKGDAFGPQHDTFLEGVSTPSLEKFTFDFASSIYCAVPVEHLLPFLTRSRCRHKRISLLNYNERLYWPKEETIQLLEGLPTVESVTLSTLQGGGTEIFSDLFLQRLAQDNLIPSTDVHLDVFLPRLQVLSFSGSRSFNWGCLADTFEAVSNRRMRESVSPRQLELTLKEHQLLHLTSHGHCTSSNLISFLTTIYSTISTIQLLYLA
ncbi:hypothetical protein GALMADRAFT_912617 [Galerina marginata CBS 339.88]|uniref:F-box domain-containing protein n=1 Tax=Galerina marginata (strain CBS 339.88) TaxID=685588 RepID=A0A067SIM8_GALM3|nr:hypothetical protein GALMADRAFT_912617 [Galerina marginata CBS 339.88]